MATSIEMTDLSTTVQVANASIPEDDTTLLLNLEETKPHPIWTGKTFAFCYRNGYPMFTIGPHCN